MATRYHNYGLTLSKNQINKLKKAYEDETETETETKLRISKDNLTGKMELPLTITQINKIKKAIEDEHGVELKFSKTQLSHINEKTGGFLPLLSLIPLVISALGAAGGLAGGIASAKNSTRQANEQERHNKEKEKIEREKMLQKEGSGINFLDEPVPIADKTLSTQLKKLGLSGSVKGLEGVKWGEGLYLQRQGTDLF